MRALDQNKGNNKVLQAIISDTSLYFPIFKLYTTIAFSVYIRNNKSYTYQKLISRAIFL